MSVAFPDRFVYTPSAGFSGRDAFTFQATDWIGAASSVATATIDVLPNTPAGSDVVVRPAYGVTLTFASVTSAGVTTASSSPSGPAPPRGFRIPELSYYWDISTTAVYRPPVEVCLTRPAFVIDPRLIHYVGGVGTDVTTRVDAFVVCGAVSALSPFVVAEPTFRGVFGQPLAQSADGQPVRINTVKNGRALPVKVRISDGQTGTTDRNAPGPVTIAVSRLAGCADATGGAPIGYGDAGRSNGGTDHFRYDADEGLWIYNLDTKALGLATGACYRIDVLVDGTPLLGDFVVVRPRD